MNSFIGSGRLVRDAVVNGNGKVLKFTLVAQYGYDVKAEKPRIEYVPCVMFNPGEKLTELLATQGKGMMVEFQGRVSTSKFEANGEVQYRTEVVVSLATFCILNP